MKQNKNNCDLQSCSLCKGCLKEWLPALDVNRKTFDFKKGERLFAEGDEVTGIYFMLSGKAKVHKKWEEDKELIVRFAGPGDIVGHRGLGKDRYYQISATAIEPVSACFVELGFFHATLKVNHEYAYQLLMFFAEELQESEKRMRNLAHMPVKGRIAYGLLRLQEKFGSNADGFLNINLSRHDLASYAGTTYETAFRVMSDFVHDQLVLVSGKGVAILNEELLRSHVQ